MAKSRPDLLWIRSLIEAALIILGLIIGGLVGVYIGNMRGRATSSEQVPALEATLNEVRNQLATKNEELSSLRDALETQKINHAKAGERLESAREHFAEQRRQIEEMEKKVKDTFQALSARALQNSNEQFITLADAKIKPLRDQLERYEKHIKEMEKTRAEAYGGLSKHLASLEIRSEQLGKETGQLVAALRQSGAKGKWGEVTLQRIVELSGMSEHCDFQTQATQTGGLRPDLVVHLPGSRMLAVDSKVNTSNYLDAMNATNEAERKRLLAKYCNDVRKTLRELSSKEYWKTFSAAPEFVIMFMPGEAFFAAALSQDRDLLTEGVEKKVLLASPTTLIALLLAVRHGWQQHRMAENAEKIADSGRELYDRLCTFVTHLDSIRIGIEKAAEAYNKAAGSWERRTLPSVRKLRDLGARTGKEVEPLQQAEVPMQSLLPTEEDANLTTRRAL
ncbi:MAG: DNA recombination protein RmuC [Phycisphaerales bacterium]|nr:DNA recombination protein RmuC [Phycisphaerales bacterium]